MKGSKLTSNLGLVSFGSTATIVTFSLNGRFNIISHLHTSGNLDLRIRIVDCVAVAVINNNFPPIPLRSPEAKSIAGRKAFFFLDPVPQLATIISHIRRMLCKGSIIILYLNVLHQLPSVRIVFYIEGAISLHLGFLEPPH